jgi:hypothetical protein
MGIGRGRHEQDRPLTPRDLSTAAYGLCLAGEYVEAESFVSRAIKKVFNDRQLEQPGHNELYVRLHLQRAGIRLDSVGHYPTARESSWALVKGLVDAERAHAHTVAAWGKLDRKEAEKLLKESRAMIERGRQAFDVSLDGGHTITYPESWLTAEGNLSAETYTPAEQSPLVAVPPAGPKIVGGLGHVARGIAGEATAEPQM